MAFYLVAFGLALHVLLWGAGLAALVVPRPWRRFWPVFCAPAGLGLQSAVVWAGAYSGLAGTDVYGRWSELVPVALLAWAVRRGAVAGVAWRRLGGLGLVTAGCLALLVHPLAHASRYLTTASLGSCDAADYAAGARVLQEFSRGDRSGFLGLTEVVQVASVDNFFDFWLRLNHFTPSALIALNGAVAGLQGYQIIGLLTAVLLALSLPLVYWLARTVLRCPAGGSLWLAAIYGLAPATWYAVAQVAIGQLLAAQAIALLTWAGICLWRRFSWRRAAALAPLLFLAYWLVLGSYNFIVLVCLVPAAAYAGGAALRRGCWGRLACWAAAVLLPLAACGLVFPERVLGLAERFRLFREFDFGWRIPVFSPDGWLGALGGPGLAPVGGALRWILAAAAVALPVFACVRQAARRPQVVGAAASLVLPALAGYAWLEAKGLLRGTNSSYDAYKLFAVFFPGLLAGMCCWLTLLPRRSRGGRALAVGAAALVTLANLAAVRGFTAGLENPPLIVDRDLLEVRGIERMPDVASLNLRIPDMWSRLWANAFLLRKPQYFATHTYEGRRDTPLRGEQDLNGGLLQPETGDGGFRRINPQYSLLETGTAAFLRPRDGAGWYDLERDGAAGAARWRWTQAAAAVAVDSPLDRPLATTWRFARVHSLVERDFQLWVGGRLFFTARVGTGFTDLVVPGVLIPAGGTTVEVRTDTPLVRPAGDARALGFQIFDVAIEVHPDGKPADPSRS